MTRQAWSRHVVALALLALPACGPGAEPSEREMRQAIEAAGQPSEYANGMRILYANVTLDFRVEIERLHKLYCEPARQPDTLVCHVELTMRFPPLDLPPQTQRVRLHMVRKPGGWYLL